MLTAKEKNERLKVIRKNHYSRGHKDGKDYLYDPDVEIVGELDGEYNFKPSDSYGKEIPQEIRDTFCYLDGRPLPDRTKPYVTYQDTDYTLYDFDQRLRKADTAQVLEDTLKTVKYTIHTPEQDFPDIEQVLGAGEGGLFRHIQNMQNLGKAAAAAESALIQERIGSIEDYMPDYKTLIPLEPIPNRHYVINAEGMKFGAYAYTDDWESISKGQSVRYVDPKTQEEVELDGTKDLITALEEAGEEQMAESCQEQFKEDEKANLHLLNPIPGYHYVITDDGKQYSGYSYENHAKLLSNGNDITYVDPKSKEQLTLKGGKGLPEALREAGREDLASDCIRQYRVEMEALLMAEGKTNRFEIFDPDEEKTLNLSQLDKTMREEKENKPISLIIHDGENGTEYPVGLLLGGSQSGKGLAEHLRDVGKRGYAFQDQMKTLQDQYQAEMLDAQKSYQYKRTHDIKEYRENLAHSFEELLTRDGGNWQRDWLTKGAPRNYESGRPYSGENFIFLKLAETCYGFDDPRWLTCHEIKTDPNLSLKQGARNMDVRYCFPADENGTMSWQEYNKLRHEVLAGDKPKDALKNIRYVNKFYAVVNASQVNGVEPINVKAREVNEPDVQIENLADALDVKLKNEGRDQAYYSRLTDIVHLPKPEQFINKDAYRYSALHELTHATGAAKRLNRKNEGIFGDENYAEEELVAEMGACFEAANMGIKDVSLSQVKNSNAYVKSWLQAIQDQPEAMGKAIGNAMKAAKYMDERLESYDKMQKRYPILEAGSKRIETYPSGNKRVTLSDIRENQMDFWGPRETVSFYEKKNLKGENKYFLFSNHEKSPADNEVLASSDTRENLKKQRKEKYHWNEQNKEKIKEQTKEKDVEKPDKTKVISR